MCQWAHYRGIRIDGLQVFRWSVRYLPTKHLYEMQQQLEGQVRPKPQALN